MSGRITLAVGDALCVECVRRRLEWMHLKIRVVVSNQLGLGDIILLEDGEPQTFLGLCDCDVKSSGFEGLLDRIRTGQHSSYGTLSWDGRSREITETVQFESGNHEADEVVRERALRYLSALTPEERARIELEVVFREKKPVRAVLKGKTAELSPDRLVELRRLAKLR